MPGCHGYSNILLVWQAVLQQQATETLLTEGTLVSQATHTDAQHIQVHGLSRVLLLSSWITGSPLGHSVQSYAQNNL